MSCDGLLRVKVTQTKLLIDSAVNPALSHKMINGRPSSLLNPTAEFRVSTCDLVSSCVVNFGESTAKTPGITILYLSKGLGKEKVAGNSFHNSRFLSPAAAIAIFDPEFKSVPL